MASKGGNGLMKQSEKINKTQHSVKIPTEPVLKVLLLSKTIKESKFKMKVN